MRERPFFHPKPVRPIRKNPPIVKPPPVNPRKPRARSPTHHYSMRPLITQTRPVLGTNHQQKRGIATEVLMGAGAVGALGVLTSLHIVRPNQRGLVEVFGKYTRTADPGLRAVWPFGIGSMEVIPMDMHKVEIPEQSIITKEQLNATVDAVAYYRVKDPYKARYNVDDYENTVPTLAQTTLRNVLGTFTLADANSQRQSINAKLKDELESQVTDWGMEVISVELQEIRPTRRVQESMNNIIIAEQEKIAAENQAHALEIAADGKRRAAIKEAEGEARAVVLAAEADAEQVRLDAQAKADAMRLKYDTANECFKGNAMFLERLETTRESLKNNSTVLLGKENQTWNLLDIARMPQRVGEPCSPSPKTDE